MSNKTSKAANVPPVFSSQELEELIASTIRKILSRPNVSLDAYLHVFLEMHLYEYFEEFMDEYLDGLEYENGDEDLDECFDEDFGEDTDANTDDLVTGIIVLGMMARLLGSKGNAEVRRNISGTRPRRGTNADIDNNGWDEEFFGRFP